MTTTNELLADVLAEVRMLRQDMQPGPAPITGYGTTRIRSVRIGDDSTSRIEVGQHAQPGVNRTIWLVGVEEQARAAAKTLPDGSARGVVLELREALLKLLGLQLQRVHSKKGVSEPLDRCESVRHLSVGGLRSILEHADHALSDRRRIEWHPEVDQEFVARWSSDECFEFGDGSDQGGVRGPVSGDVVTDLPCDHEVVGDVEIRGVDHESSPSVGERGASTVGDGGGSDAASAASDSAPNAGPGEA